MRIKGWGGGSQGGGVLGDGGGQGMGWWGVGVMGVKGWGGGGLGVVEV